MKARFSRWILVGIFVPGLVQAQSVSPTQVALRLFEQPSGFVLGAEQRVYTSYFNTLRTRYISVEVTLDYAPAAATFKLGIGRLLVRAIRASD